MSHRFWLGVVLIGCLPAALLMFISGEFIGGIWGRPEVGRGIAFLVWLIWVFGSALYHGEMLTLDEE